MQSQFCSGLGPLPEALTRSVPRWLQKRVLSTLLSRPQYQYWDGLEISRHDECGYGMVLKDETLMKDGIFESLPSTQTKTLTSCKL